MSDEPLLFNGVDGRTGRPLEGPASTEELESLLDAKTDRTEALAATLQALEPNLAPARGDPQNLDRQGWGLIQLAPVDEAARRRNAEVREALAPLLELREQQGGRRFKLLELQPNETQGEWFARMQHPPGPIDSRILPYYLLIAAAPADIDFTFQCSLDVSAAVGRIWFDEDLLPALRAYAVRVVAAEQGDWKRPRSISFVGTTVDDATKLSNDKLAHALFDRFQGNEAGWGTEYVLGTRSELLDRLGGDRTPGVALIATHGVELRGDPRQHALQGALICQEWPGGAPAPEHMVGAADVTGDVSGLVCALFACYGLGTPKQSDYQHLRGEPTDLAPAPFVSGLAQRLIERGALAVIGHIDRAWGWSFELDEPLAGGGSARVPQLLQFETAIEGIISGERVGAALENFGQRYASLGTRLANELEVRRDRVPRPRYLAQLWTATNDARGYALLGDPAVRIGARDGTGVRIAPTPEPSAAAPPKPTTVRERLADWAGALNDDDFACALTMRGLVSEAEWARDIAGVEAVLAAKLATQRQLLWAWFDGPIPVDAAAVAARWRAFVAQHRPLRCCNWTAEIDAVPWLSREVVGFDGVLAVMWGTLDVSTQTRWPLRVVDLTSRVAPVLATSWVNNLSIRLTGPDEVEPAGLVIIDGPFDTAGRALADEHRYLRATTVLVLGPREDEAAMKAWSLARGIEASAVILTELTDPTAVARLVEEMSVQLSHDAPLDVAVLEAARRQRLPPPALWCQPHWPESARLSNHGRGLVADLLGADVGAGTSYTTTLNAGIHPGTIDALDWGSEHGAATFVGHLDQERQQLRDGSADRTAPRYLQATVTADRESIPAQTMRPGEVYSLSVFIGEADPLVLAVANPIAEPYVGVETVVDVIVSEPNLLVEPLRGTIVLPPGGASTKATFTIVTREGVARLELRVILMHRDRILQTGIIRGAIDGKDQLQFHVDAVGRSRLGGLEHRRRFDAAIVANHTTGGEAGYVGKAQDDVGYIKLDNTALAGLTKALGDSLSAIAADPDKYRKLRDPANVDLLRELALRGANFHSKLTKHNVLGPGLLRAKRLQVVAARVDTFLPIELAYTHPAPDPNAGLCKGAEDALKSGACPTTCGAPDADRICPLGFWSMSRVIERQAHRPEHIAITSDYELRNEALSPQRASLRAPKAAVMAADNRADLGKKGTLAALEKTLGATFGASAVRRAKTWKEWVAGVGAVERPCILVLLPHHKDGDESDGILQIGENDELRALNVRADHVTGNPAKPPSPIVLLLGCATSIAQVPYESFVSVFRDLDAALVISTISTVLGRDAGPVAGALVTELVAAHAAGGYAGDALLRVRRKMLLDGKAMVLALTAYGDADWKLSPT